jgi:hypothetical protein
VKVKKKRHGWMKKYKRLSTYGLKREKRKKHKRREE